jgi:hypothetical protein
LSSVNTFSTVNQAQTFRTQVKMRLIERNMTITGLARRLRKSRVCVSQAVNHATMFPGIQGRIRKELGL